jgi:hypothetical protein
MPDKLLQTQQDNIRIPLYDTEGFRTDYAGFDQCLINCYAEVIRNPTTGDGDILITKRSGITQTEAEDLFTQHFTAGGDGTQYPLANYCVTNLYDVYVSAWKDGTNIRIIQYRPQANTSTLLGTIVGSSTRYDRIYFSHGWSKTSDNPTWVLTINFEDGRGATNKAYTCEASGGYFSAGTIAEITDVQSPWGGGVKTRGPILQLNNQWYVASVDGRIYSTGTTSPTASYVSQADIVKVGPNFQGWCSIARFITSEFPEQFEGLILYKHHLVAYGRTSIQFFTDEGESLDLNGIPILPTDQALIRFGVYSGKHILNVDDVLYWLSYGKDSTIGLWKLDGYTPVKISQKRQDIQVTDYYSQFQGTHLEENIFCIYLGNKKHIGISGVTAYQSLYGNFEILTPQPGGGFIDDVTFGNTQKTDQATIRGHMAMYNIEDKTWWYLNCGDTTGILYPVTSFGNPIASTYNLDPWRQYILKRASITTFEEDLKNSYLYRTTDNDFLDFDNDLYTNTSFVHCVVQTNNYMFMNERRKRVSRARLILGLNYPKDSYNNFICSIIFSWNTSNTYNDYPEKRTFYREIVIPNAAYRYYVNNLGSMRQVNFCIHEKSPYAVTFKAIELDLAQGVN